MTRYHLALVVLLPLAAGCDSYLSGPSTSDISPFRVDKTCGNGTCNTKETCGNCPQDCGECPAPSSGSEADAGGVPGLDGAPADEPDQGVLPDSTEPTPLPDQGLISDARQSLAPDQSISPDSMPAPADLAPPPQTSLGLWISPSELAALPTSGDAWQSMLSVAQGSLGTADVSDQDSGHDVATLAAALVCARLKDPTMCTRAKAAVVAAIGTEQGGRWLAVGRNLTAYVIAADVLGLRADGDPNSDGSRVDAWITSFLTMTLAQNNDPSQQEPLIPFGSGSNASAQEGAAYAAVAAYAGDSKALQRAWDAFRTYACDAGAPDNENIDISKGVLYGWAHDDTAPCAVNPAGTTKVVPAGRSGAGNSYRIDGAIINDMRRGGHYQWPPGYTQYPWVGLEGFVPAALILHRAGYPAFQVADQAVRRTFDYLWFLRQQTGDAAWFDGKRADEVTHLANVAYGMSWPTQSAVGDGRCVGFTDWTHPNGI